MPNYNLYTNLNQFLQHIHVVFEKKGFKLNISPVYEMNYPILTNDKLGLYLDKYNLIHEKKAYRRKLKDLIDSDDKRDCQKDIEKVENKIHEVDEDIKVCSSDLRVIDDLYITFTNQHLASVFAQEYSMTAFTRFFMICCCRKDEIEHLYWKGEWMDVRAFPDEPSNLKWQNIPYSGCRRFARICLSVLIAIVVVLFSFGIVIGGKYVQNREDKVFNSDVDCSFVDYSNTTLILNEYNNPNVANINKIMTYCFCKDYLYTNGPVAANDYTINNIKLCKTWVESYVQSYAINIGIIVAIPVINSILVMIFRALTEFERNKTVSFDKMSNIWKIFIMQMINTGLILLLVNADVKAVYQKYPDFPLFTGKYQDLTPQWYYDIGSTIAFSLILNVFIPHLAIIMSQMLTLCRRCWDSGCTCDGSKSKLRKSIYKELYTGPDFLIDCRYSELLTTIFVTQIYSSGLPILYVAVFFSLFLTYWVDKFMLLNYYRKPPQYDLYMSKLFNSVVLFGVLIHYLIGFWIYGNSTLLNSPNTQASIKVLNVDTYVDTSALPSDVTSRMLPHNIMILVFIAILVGVVLIRYTLYQLMVTILCKSCTESDAGQIRTIEISTALPLRKMFEIYKLRKLQMKKIKEFSDKHTLNKFFTDAMKYDQTSMKDKIFNITKVVHPELNENFDKNIVETIDKITNPEVVIIGGDYSYNFSHQIEFEAAAEIEYNYDVK